MDENTKNELSKLLSALKALRTSVNNARHMEIHDTGSAAMLVKTYTTLHARIAELLPDDYYITEALRLDIAPELEDKAKIAQVHLAVDQLYNYLKDQTKGGDWADFAEFGRNFTTNPDVKELADLGRELQSQIIERTRGALRRALSGLEVEFEKEYDKEKHERKARVEIHHDDAPTAEDESNQPETPDRGDDEPRIL